ncbi:hypothetical protein H0X91_17990 [Burkholderia sp. 9777_1386]|uniref:hypothetical protein n=1 Tax=Burkholderia sp. 9777_1386 TaxID=2751183 RepID=UPI0018C3D890|nr:hypothetical protein [Burkholderia sp. 9777_1386]MBG0871862.1 hypothetical protein [Burkholderia sp. 9777_1386]
MAKGDLQKAADEFCNALAARALVIAIEWAGSASALARALGESHHNGTKWAQRGHIPVRAAIKLAKLPGFPLSVGDMCPGVDLRPYKLQQCPRCGRRSRYWVSGGGSFAMLSDRLKAAREKG